MWLLTNYCCPSPRGTTPPRTDPDPDPLVGPVVDDIDNGQSQPQLQPRSPAQELQQERPYRPLVYYPRRQIVGPESKMVVYKIYKRSLASSWFVKNGKEEVTRCAICLEDFKKEDECLVLAKCEHLFHGQCADTWLKREPVCPICRGTVPMLGPFVMRVEPADYTA